VLRYPPTDHPIFRQGIRSDAKVKLPWLLWLIALILAPILILPGLILSGTTYSLFWAIQISNYLTQARSHKDYDLLCALPCGEFGVNWLFSTGYLHRGGAFARLHGIGFWGARLIFMALIVYPVLKGALISETDDSQAITASILAVAIIVMLVVNHYQSVVMGGLIGILIPAKAKDRFNVPLFVIGAYVALQSVSYLATAILAWILLGDGFSAHNDLQIALRIFDVVVVFIAIREFIVIYLWRTTLATYQTEQTEAFQLLDAANRRLV
jgi:hypothetical protein